MSLSTYVETIEGMLSAVQRIQTGVSQARERDRSVHYPVTSPTMCWRPLTTRSDHGIIRFNFIQGYVREGGVLREKSAL